MSSIPPIPPDPARRANSGYPAIALGVLAMRVWACVMLGAGVICLVVGWMLVDDAIALTHWVDRTIPRALPRWGVLGVSGLLCLMFWGMAIRLLFWASLASAARSVARSTERIAERVELM